MNSNEVFIGRKMRMLRVQRGISQKAVQEGTGIHQSTLSYIENGKACGVEDAERIATFLGCSVQDLTEEPIVATGMMATEQSSIRQGELINESLSTPLIIDALSRTHSQVAVEYQRTVGSSTEERWDRVRVSIQVPCDSEEVEATKERLMESAIESVENTLKKLSIQSTLNPIPDLKMK